jgi:hypothetical protein
MEYGVVLPVSSLTWERQDPPAAISIFEPTYRQAPLQTQLAVLHTKVLLPSSSTAKKHLILGEYNAAAIQCFAIFWLRNISGLPFANLLLEALKDGRKLAVSLPQFSFHSGRPPLALSQATRVPEPSMRLRSAYRTFSEMIPVVQQKQQPTL